MTDKEKAIVMAFTGITMLSGEKFSIFHKYVEDIMGRPVFTHELANKDVCKQIKELSVPDFLSLCENTENERPQGEWLFIDNEVGWDVCSNCNWTDARCHTWRYCPNCGAYMR